MAAVDLTKWFLKTKRKNYDPNGNILGEEFDTKDYVGILTWDDVKDRNASDKFKHLTDDALISFGCQMQYIADKDKRPLAPYLDKPSIYTESGYACVMGNGVMQSQDVSSKDLPVALTMRLDTAFFESEDSKNVNFEFEHKQTENGERHFFKIGENTKSSVGKTLRDTLEKLYNGGDIQEGLVCTGRFFTSNGQTREWKDFLSRQNPEFIYQGERFVRKIVRNSMSYCYEDGADALEFGEVEWLRVEPILFEIMNWDNLSNSINQKGNGNDKFLVLETKDAVLSGIPFYPTWQDRNCKYYQNSLLRCFCNSAKSEDLDRNLDVAAKLTWDFSKSGFFYQSFNLAREPIEVYDVPEKETEVADFALAGCVGIKKVNIHKSVTKIGENAFDGCDFRFAYTLKGKQGLVISKEMPNDEEVGAILNIDKITKVIADFDYSLLLHYEQFESICKLADILTKSKVTLPYIFVDFLIENNKLEEFEQNCTLKFFESSLDFTKSEKYKTLDDDKKLTIYNFMYAFGCFSKEKMRDKRGLETEVVFGQKASSAFSLILRKELLDTKKIIELFRSVTTLEKPSQEFLNFIYQNGEDKKFQNLELLLRMENTYPNIFAKVMTNFEKAKEFRDTIGVNGKPIKRSWEDAFKKFYSAETYSNVNKENEDIAEVFSSKGIEETLFEKTSRLRKEAKANGVEEHILSKPLKEKSILQYIEELRMKTEELLSDSKQMLDELYAKKFTYEMLSKYDPKNAIIGVYVNCCAVIDNCFHGNQIASATITSPDVQNLVIRDLNGEIVAKGTIYVDRVNAYAVINDFELNYRLREDDEITAGRYITESEHHSKNENDREMVFDAILRGVKAFVKEYDLENPCMPIMQVNVGMGMNRLKAQCERYEKETNNLSVPAEYGFKDAEDEQRVLYKRENENAKKGGREK